MSASVKVLYVRAFAKPARHRGDRWSANGTRHLKQPPLSLRRVRSAGVRGERRSAAGVDKDETAETLFVELVRVVLSRREVGTETYMRATASWRRVVLLI